MPRKPKQNRIVDVYGVPCEVIEERPDEAHPRVRYAVAPDGLLFAAFEYSWGGRDACFIADYGRDGMAVEHHLKNLKRRTATPPSPESPR